MTWDLDEIYTSIDSESCKTDINKLNDYITNINRWVDENLINVIEITLMNVVSLKLNRFLELNNEYQSIYLRLYNYADLLVSVDGNNAKAMKMLDEIENANAELTKSFVVFTKWLCSIANLEEVINSSPYLLEHQFYLSEITSKSKYMLNESEEQLIIKMQSTGSRAWQKLYMKILASTNTSIKIDGEIKRISLGELKNIAYEKDSTLRKLASKAEKRVCKNVSQTISSCINGISGEAITLCDIKGYESITHKVLTENRMDHETLDAMLIAIRKSLPIIHKYYEAKGKLLGHQSSCPAYDIYAPIGNDNGKISYSDSKKIIIESFHVFSQELGDFAKRVFDERWIDAEPRDGKGNYGLTVDIFPIKESRIMTNYSGNYIDITVLAHEIGHAYHSYCLRDEELLNTYYPTPIAETASIFCETILNNELIKRVLQEDKITILERSISDSVYYIAEMYGRFLFEVELYKKRKTGILSVNELNGMMKKSMKQVYGDAIDENTINSYSWVNNIGFYMAGNEFLNFPYTFGVLFSKGLYAEYLNKGSSFVTEYEKLLKISSKNNIVTLANYMNINVHSSDFWTSALKIIEADINEFIKEVNTL